MCKIGMQVIAKKGKEFNFYIFVIAVDNNQGLEGTHAQYKKDHTFRSEVALSEFVQITENLVRIEF